MAARRLEVPYLLVVYESDAEAFGDAVLFDEHSQPFYPFACTADIGQGDVEDGILRHAVLYQRIIFQHLVTAEDAFRSAHAHACRVEAGTAPVAV